MNELKLGQARKNLRAKHRHKMAVYGEVEAIYKMRAAAYSVCCDSARLPSMPEKFAYCASSSSIPRIYEGGACAGK